MFLKFIQLCFEKIFIEHFNQLLMAIGYEWGFNSKVFQLINEVVLEN